MFLPNEKLNRQGVQYMTMKDQDWSYEYTTHSVHKGGVRHTFKGYSFKGYDIITSVGKMTSGLIKHTAKTSKQKKKTCRYT